ncbi:MAG: DUF3795 domain-containing protein [Bacteroidales bacterium]|nr:DUF3795 domain-containing protein [Bacteroidales bacterium]
MNTMIAYCGLACESCPIHLATLETDKIKQQALRESIAEICRKHYGIHLTAKEVNDCDGCKAYSDVLFSGCRKCEIRKCAINRDLESCAFCEDYACDKLREHFSLDPGAQERLEEIRQSNSI